jgi:hypothetical protein
LIAIHVTDRDTAADRAEQILLPLRSPDVGAAIVVHKSADTRLICIQLREEWDFFDVRTLLQRNRHDFSWCWNPIG